MRPKYLNIAKRTVTLAVPLAVILAAGGCKSDGGLGRLDDDPILRLSGEESLKEGKELIEQKKYARARDYLTHAFEVEPNSASGREALLLAADTLFLQGGSNNFVKAEAKYRDFQNRFPTSERSGYVQFQIANSLSKRMLRPDRDQSATFKALEAFREVILLYPDSEYANQAREQIGVVQINLAESEYMIGHFNHRFGLHTAAIARLEPIERDFPVYTEMDKVLYLLGVSHVKIRQGSKAAVYFDRLRDEYPESEFVSKIPQIGAQSGETAQDGGEDGEPAEEAQGG